MAPRLELYAFRYRDLASGFARATAPSDTSHMDSGEGIRFLSGPNWSIQKQWDGIVGGQSNRCVGDMAFESSPMHYPWWVFTSIRASC